MNFNSPAKINSQKQFIYVIKIFTLAILYFVAGKLSFSVAQSNAIVTVVIFAAEGFALSAVIIFGRNIWPGIFLGQLALALSEGLSLMPSVAISTINSVEAIIAVMLFNYFNLKPSLERLKDVFGLLLLITFILQPFSATLGNTVLWMSSLLTWQEYPASWFAWWFGNTMGQMLIAPMILLLYSARKEINGREVIVGGLILGLCGYLLFRVIPAENLALTLSITTPFIVIIAIYRGAGRASLATAILAAESLYATHAGFGPFSHNGVINIVDLNYYIFTLIILSLFIGVLVTILKKQSKKLEDNIKRLDFALSTAHQGWFELNIQTGEVSVSDEYARLLGLNPKHFHPSYQRWFKNIHPDDRDSVLKSFKECIDTGTPQESEYRIRSSSNEWLWMHSIGDVTELDPQNNPLRMVGIHRDITQSKNLEVDLQKGEQVLRLLAEHGASDSDNLFTLIIQQLAISQGVRYALIAQIDSKNPSQVNTIAVWADNNIIDNFSYNLKGTPCSNVIKNDACFYPSDIQHLFPEDRLLEDMHAESYIGVPLKKDNGHVLGIIALLDDKPMIERPQTINLLNSLSVRTSIELERIESNKKIMLSARVFSDTHEGITITDAEMNIIDINPAFTVITGYSRDDVIGKNPRILSSGKQSPEFYQDMWQHINKYGHWQGEIWNRKKDGEIYAELITISALKDELDHVVNYVGVFSDVTHSKRQQEQLSLMAHYDVLTGLPNRALFTDRFYQAIAHSKRTGSQLAVCFLDLDHFKPVNDAYGHEVGDKLLIEVSKRVIANIRDEDTVSRQGGDEFALLLGEIESFSQCEHFLDRLNNSLSEPYIIEGVKHNISASIGVTLYPFDDADLDSLLRHADQAMYQAKQAGRNRHHLFSVEQDQQNTYKYHQLDEIERALINKQFQLYYQPKVNMVTGDVFGAEALIRWIHPEKGLIPPLDFLPIIEGTELEIKIGNWVINEALSQLEIWHQQDMRPEVSVNISSHHLLSETFFTDLDTVMSQHPTVDSQCLQIEILESSALGDLNAITTVIEACQGVLGVKVALDDFGTGYSSLTHLRSLPANTIKIDQSFVKGMIDDPSDYAIIDGIIGLADSFGRQVIAEGVETTDHGLMLLMMGCEEAQGYGIAKPMPANKYHQWLNDYTPNKEWLLCGNKHRTVKENKIILFKLLTEHWKNRFIENIQSSPEDVEHWPIMNSKHCPCGSFIQRGVQEQLFEPEGLEKLNQAHEALHITAHAFQLQYQNGEMDAAREGVPDLQSSFDEMTNALRMCQ